MDEKWRNNLGVQSAHVASGPTRDERRRRLEQVPEHLRERVEIHVRTVFALRRKSSNCGGPAGDSDEGTA